MKRILLVAAGALGTAGMIALAAPASADTSATPKLGNSEVVNTFLYGNCDGKPVCPNPKEVSHAGILNQFDFFRQDLKSQSTTFGKSIDPSNQLEKFAKSITATPTTPKPE